MGINFSIKKYNKSIRGKIIITCLLACAAIFLSVYISRFTFGRILSTVDRLSKPNSKIQLVNTLFRDVVILDQLQRRQASTIQPSHYTPFLKESRQLQTMLDSLRDMSLQNTVQLVRIDSMKKILYKRDLLFLKYIGLRADYLKNDTLAEEVKSLSGMIEKVRSRMDSNLITTSKATRTIIDTLEQEEQKQSLWSRVFTKRKAPAKQVQKQIQEEYNIRIDTLALGSRGDSLAQIGKTISQVELTRMARRDVLRKRQAELNQTGDVLITQLMNILNDIETDELLHAAQQNAMSNHLVNKSILGISVVLIIFILGTAVLIFFIFNDISHSNRYRKQLVIAKEEAEEAGLVKQRFLANMSHELRTPLQTIIGISEQIRNQANPKQRDLENIHQSSLHLLQIVNEVLDYSRILSGKYTLEQKAFNMQNLLEEVKEIIQVQLAVKHLAFRYEVHVNENSYYSGDPFRLKQILLNLLGNAVKFTDEGTVSLLVSEKKQDEDTSLFTFVIKDTGTGITQEDIALIFNQFEQGSNVHKKQGTGLGLSIVKALVDIQLGTMMVESTPGAGTTFTINIPYANTAATQEADAAIPITANYEKHVWVVDDDLFILELCDSILNKYHIPHSCFSSANEALSTPFPTEIGVIFLDIRMEEMDGIMLCNKLKERHPAHEPKYIALTAQVLPDEQASISQKGFDAVVMKPFLERQFMDAIYKYEAVIPQQAEPSFDLSVVHRMTDNDEARLGKILQSFVQETEKDMKTAEQSLGRNDSYGLAEALHKLAGRCGQMGISSIAGKLRTMEITLRNNSITAETRMEMEEMRKDLAIVIATINK